ncbi:hypothetical protein [Paenibacillus sp. JDR-2]|nr:hypothetical protein [Paenibacillus sp. JDR-2]ACT04211.1 hypothetical protein Pjdr2_5603 [Paenibacillus sp. JDR-2]
MKAYVVFIREKTVDPDELKIYSSKAPAGLKGGIYRGIMVEGNKAATSRS